MTKKWYIIHTASGSESRISKVVLERASNLGLESFIEEVIVPTESVVEIRKGKKVAAQKNFLPGYMLVKMEMNDKVWHMIRSIPKVSSFLGGDGKPSSIPEFEVEKIFKQMQEGSGKSNINIVFESGESVKVIDGPFESFTGVVVDVDEEKNRLKVSVSIFGRPTPVDLGYTQVEKL